MPYLPSTTDLSKAIPQRPYGITGIAMLHGSGAALLTILMFFLLGQDLFPTMRTESYATGSLRLAPFLFASVWFLIFIGNGLWRMQPGPYIVAIFFYVLAALAQLAAIIQGYVWISGSALVTVGICIYLILPRIWWSFYPKPES